MKARLVLLPGCRVMRNKRICTIIDIIDLNYALVRYHDTERCEQVAFSELHPEEESLKSSRYPSADVALATDSEWSAARKRFMLIRPILEVAKFQRSTSLYTQAAKNAGRDEATIYRWVAAYEERQTMSALLRGRRSDRGSSRLSSKVEALIGKSVKLHLKAEALNPAEITQEIAKACKERGLTAPSVSTIARRIAQIPDEAIVRAQKGHKQARSRFAPVTGSFPDANFPLQVVQIDHTPVDIIFVDEEWRQPVGGRATLTLAIDVNTRMVCGFSLAYESPSVRSVGACITHMVMPKDGFLADLGISGVTWPCWGRPAKIHTDNAAEFVGTALEFGCNEWGIELEQRPKGRPNWGGHVERAFRTFMSKVHTLEGTTFSNIKERLDYDSSGKAMMTMREFTRWFTLFLTKVYHQQGHSGLADWPPIAKWEEGILGSKDRMGRGPPERVADVLKFRIDFLPHTTRTIQRDGIGLENMTYWDDPLRRWINARDPKNTRLAREFIVKYDPYAMNEVYFVDPDLRVYFPIPLRNRARPVVSLWEIRAAAKRARQAAGKLVNEDIIFEGIEEMREEVIESARKTKAARRTTERARTWKKSSTKVAREATKSAASPSTGAQALEDDGPVAPFTGSVEPHNPTRQR
jgi:putative transposase